LLGVLKPGLDFSWPEDDMSAQSIRPGCVPLVLLAVLSVSCQTGSTPKDGAPSQATPMSIEETTWRLVEVGGKAAEPVPADAPSAHLRLSAAEKRVSGYSGVNSFSGPYELTGQSLKFGMVAMTRRAGPENLMQQERAFTQALSGTKSYRRSGDSLELLDAAGKALAKLAREDQQVR
jgi:heat shock protein HslJ